MYTTVHRYHSCKKKGSLRSCSAEGRSAGLYRSPLLRRAARPGYSCPNSPTKEGQRSPPVQELSWKLRQNFILDIFSHALQTNLNLCIHRKGIALPQSQFPHSCVCLFPGSVHIFSCSRIGRPIRGILYIYKSVTETWGIGIVAAQFLS
jgi:hypothetical protein